jgi:hypothetical protein
MTCQQITVRSGDDTGSYCEHYAKQVCRECGKRYCAEHINEHDCRAEKRK